MMIIVIIIMVVVVVVIVVAVAVLFLALLPRGARKTNPDPVLCQESLVLVQFQLTYHQYKDCMGTGIPQVSLPVF